MNFSIPFIVSPDSLLRSCFVKGPVALLQLPFYGSDVVFTSSRLFFHSKGSFVQFTQLFLKLSNSLSTGRFVELLLVGLGFRLIKLGKFLLFKLGYSHYIKLLIPSSVYVVGYKKRLIIFGAHLGDVNQFVEQVVRFRKPDIYKSKGVQVVGRVFRVKVGKQK